MADDIQLPGTGQTVATKEIGGRDFQEVIPASEKGEIINVASEEAILLLRRMVKIMESLSITDNAQRQRVAIDSIVALPANQSTNIAQIAGTAHVVNIGQSAAGSPRVTIAIDSLMDEKTMMMREAYNNGIRRNLIFN